MKSRCRFEIVFVVSQMYDGWIKGWINGWMDGWMDSVSLRRFCGKSDVWTDG